MYRLLGSKYTQNNSFLFIYATNAMQSCSLISLVLIIKNCFLNLTFFYNCRKHLHGFNKVFKKFPSKKSRLIPQYLPSPIPNHSLKFYHLSFHFLNLSKCVFLPSFFDLTTSNFQFLFYLNDPKYYSI